MPLIALPTHRLSAPAWRPNYRYSVRVARWRRCLLQREVMAERNSPASAAWIPSAFHLSTCSTCVHHARAGSRWKRPTPPDLITPSSQRAHQEPVPRRSTTSNCSSTRPPSKYTDGGVLLSSTQKLGAMLRPTYPDIL